MTQYSDKVQAMAQTNGYQLKIQKRIINIESWKWPEYALQLGSIFLISRH